MTARATCPQCGKQFIAPARGRAKLFCSANCRLKSHRSAKPSFVSRHERSAAVSKENPVRCQTLATVQTCNESHSGGPPSQLGGAMKPEVQESSVRVMKVHRIDLIRPREGKQYGPIPMWYRGQPIGRANAPIFAAARWLLANGHAEPGDTIAIYRGDTLCMSGKAGELAKWTVKERDKGGLSLEIWRPYSPVPPLAPESSSLARRASVWCIG